MTVSRSSLNARGMISTPMRMPATASQPVQPVTAIATAARITASDPNASLTTSRNAARRLKFALRPAASTSRDAVLPSSPITPNTSRPAEAISGGANRR